MRIAVACLALGLAAPAAAETPNPSPPVQPGCELHFWPASSVSTYPQVSQSKGGPLWSLLTNGQKRAEGLQAVRSEMASRLDAEGSVAALGRDDLPARLRLQNAKLIVHDTPLPERGLYSIKARRAASNSPCYSELIVTSLQYRAGSWGGHLLDSSFLFLEYGSEAQALRWTRGGASTKLSSFPAKEGENTDAATADLNSAFRKNFEIFVAKTDATRSGPLSK